jgi:hypothetical protein
MTAFLAGMAKFANIACAIMPQGIAGMSGM